MKEKNPYGFTDFPFHVTPDTRFLYLHRALEEALASLNEVVAGGKGFAVVTGEVGAGKTTLLRSFLDRMPVPAETAVLFQTDLGPEELLREVALELGIPVASDPAPTKQTMIEKIRDRLLETHAAGKTVVLLIDEAQNLPLAALESVRMLSNLETEREKLIQIILFGQTELADLLARPEARQIRSRIAARVHLGPLGLEETEAYLRHRIEIARPQVPVAFTKEATSLLRDATGGIPRLVNLVADRALALAGAGGPEGACKAEVAAEEIAQAAKNHPALAAEKAPSSPVLPIAAAAAVLVVVGGISAIYMTSASPASSSAPPPTYREAERVAPTEPPPAPRVDVTSSRWLSMLGETAPHLALLDPEVAARVVGLEPVRIDVEAAKIGRIGLPALLVPQKPFTLDRPALVVEDPTADSGILLDLPSGMTQVPARVLPEKLTLLYALPRAAAAIPALRPGDRGPEVERLERRLVDLGRLPGRADESYGTKTRLAVLALQKEMGIRADGIYGIETSVALYGLEGAAVRGAEPALVPAEPARRGT